MAKPQTPIPTTSLPSTTSAKSSKRKKFAGWVVDALTPLGPVRAQGMFGGHGIFLVDLMLGLNLENQLWLKADYLNRSLYRDASPRCFVYKRMGKPVELGFWRVLPEIWNDPHELIAWAESAFAATKRTKAWKR